MRRMGAKVARQADPDRALLDVGVELDVVVQKELLHVVGLRETDLETLSRRLQLALHHEILGLERDRLLHVALRDRSLELVEGQLLGAARTVEEVLHEESQQYHQEDGEGGALEEPAHLALHESFYERERYYHKGTIRGRR